MFHRPMAILIFKSHLSLQLLLTSDELMLRRYYRAGAYENLSTTISMLLQMAITITGLFRPLY